MISLIMLATAFPVLDRVDIVQGWRVHRSADGTCGIEAEVNGREYFAATSPQIPEQYAIGVGGKTWQSLVPYQPYPMTVTVKDQAIAGQGWGREGFMGYRFVYTLIPKAVFDEAVVKRRAFTFSINDRAIGQVMFNLLAIGAVNRCGNAAANPFSQ